MLDSTVSFSDYVHYNVFTAGRFAYTPKQISVFTGKRCHFPSSRGVIFTRSYLLRPANIHVKNYSAIARRKNKPFYPARTGINFSYFQLARRSFRFPSQLTSQCFSFQLAQTLPDERVFCRAAPSGTDCGLGINKTHGPGIKCELRTMF